MEYEFCCEGNDGVPVGSLTPTWYNLVRRSDGAAQSQPTISAVGTTGWYKFSATIPAGEKWLGWIDLGVSVNKRYLPIHMTTDDVFAGEVRAKLPSKNYLTGTANADGDIQMSDATGNFPGTVSLTSDYDRAKDAASSTEVGDVGLTVMGVPSAVWAAGTRTLTSFGSLVTDISTAIGTLITNLKTSISGWLFNRSNTVVDGKIASYVAGTGDDAKTVNVTYDADGIPTSETPS